MVLKFPLLGKKVGRLTTFYNNGYEALTLERKRYAKKKTLILLSSLKLIQSLYSKATGHCFFGSQSTGSGTGRLFNCLAFARSKGRCLRSVNRLWNCCLFRFCFHSAHHPVDLRLARILTLERGNATVTIVDPASEFVLG